MTIDRSNLAHLVGKASPFTSARQEAFLNLTRTEAIASAPFDRLFKSHGVSQPLYNILRILAGHRDRDADAGRAHEGVPVLRIGEDMVTREPDMTRLVNRLEKAGLAERRRCAHDRRIVYVRITTGGEELLDRLAPEIEELHASQFRGLSDEEITILNDLLFRAAITIAATNDSATDEAGAKTDQRPIAK